MKAGTITTLLGIALTTGLFSSCDALEDVYDDPEVEIRSGQYYVDATKYDQWVYVNLRGETPIVTVATISHDDGSETGAPADWDIAHHRYDAKTNGAKVYMTDCHSIDELEQGYLPAGGSWTEDEYDDNNIIVDMSHMMEGYLDYAPGYKNKELGKWVEVDTSTMPPNYAMHDNVYVIRLKDGTYAALQLENFMSTDRYQIKGWMTVNYKYPLK